MDKVQLSNEFKVFAKDCEDSSPLYEFLALKIAKNDGLLELSTYTLPGQPAPNVLLGAVHHLLSNGVNHLLATFYPSITKNTKKPTHSFDDLCFPYPCS